MDTVVLCPGQGAQAIGMGKAWCEASPAARAIFDAADRALAGQFPGGASLSAISFGGPAESLNRTDVSQPALYACGVACFRGLIDRGLPLHAIAAAGLSLGEYTALHLAGAFSFEDGLRLVALRGKLMQEAAEASKGGMVALIGADEAQAQAVCDQASLGEVLVCANFNAPGQIVLSGHQGACRRAVEVAPTVGVKAAPLQVAGAFHSPLMAPAAEGLAGALERTDFRPLEIEVWSNVTARPHRRDDSESVRKLLADQLVSPVRWAQSCGNLLAAMAAQGRTPAYREMAPGSVLKGLFRRIDRACEVNTHDQPTPQPVG
jgi:[acyl-carrier-protein] S-malonyltransferase